MLRVATSPSYGEIIKPRFQQWRSKKKSKKNRRLHSLKRHTIRFEGRHGKIDTIEKLQPFSAPPDWIPSKIVIHKTKEKAKKLAEETLNEGYTKVDTDGSGITKKVGAAAVSTDIDSAFGGYLGTSNWYTVYSAKMHGILRALTVAIIYHSELQIGTVVINIDKKSSVQALGNPGKHSGQVYVIQAVQLINTLRGLGATFRLQWIPAHIGIQGNEWADRMAKEATGWRERVNHGKKIEIDTDEVANGQPFRRE